MDQFLELKILQVFGVYINFIQKDQKEVSQF